MEFNEVIDKRRSIRNYIEKEVTNEEIEEVIKSAMKSPSAHNMQPWKVMITKGEKKDKIADLLLKKSTKIEDSSLIVTANTIKKANVLLLIFYVPLSKIKDFDVLSIGSFIEHICLKATDMDLGSLWIANTSYVNEEIKEMLNSPYDCISTVALGYREYLPKERPRKSWEEVVVESF